MQFIRKIVVSGHLHLSLLALAAAGPALAQLRYVRGRLDSILGARGLRLVAYVDEPYSPHLPVTVANPDEFQGN